MDSNQECENFSDTLGRDYFDFYEYTDRLFYEYKHREPSIDSCSDKSSIGSTVESGSNYLVEDARKSNLDTSKQPREIQRKKNDKRGKARRMQQFRKWLLPKNAISTLNELRAPTIPDMAVYPCGPKMKAEVVVDNVKYEAIERNKNLAKATASERALRGLVVEQVAKQNEHTNLESLPIERVAPFAIHKLFTEWEVPGFNAGRAQEMANMKQLKPEAAATVDQRINMKMPKVTKTVSDLPPNAAEYNPGMLFSYMRPQVTYENLGLSGDPTKMEYIAGIRTDGYYFFGSGRSRKLARKAAAMEALSKLFGIVYKGSGERSTPENYYKLDIL
ncbi:double-stranded RNA-specific editase B2-like [Anopheles funestus]|uniref:double-stranded RNA-specific editase B2-like n=1 Tax=Anopheles funestus TaxID=62324 RepID=UPI0020C6EFCF|nr:double-stranded RNA-specific editase B2-like [Anopheles funestus]